jgi:hypothetical protein
MTPAERIRNRQQLPATPLLPQEESVSAPADSIAVVRPRYEQLLDNPPVTRTKENFRRPLHPNQVRLATKEEHLRSSRAEWYECFFYTARAGFLILGLAALLTLLSGSSMAVLPALAAKSPDEREYSSGFFLIGSFALVAVLVPAGYVCRLLEGALASGASGRRGQFFWPGRSVALALRSSLRWLVCFLAGPVLFASAGLIYWLRCGDPDLLDRIILAELGVLTVGYGLFAILAVSRNDRLRDANPGRVAGLFHFMGYRALAAAGLASALVLSHGYLLLLAIDGLTRNPGKSWLLLGCSWLSGLVFATSLFHLLGTWCRRALPA